MSKDKNWIVISDTHFPYHHPDTFKFLKAIKEFYEITDAAHVGDVNDNHYPSFHDSEPDCYSGVDEIKKASEACQQLEEIFPELLISEGNHDILPQRKANAAQVPLEWVADPNRVYGLKGGWEWSNKHYLDLGNGEKCLLVHSIGSNTISNSRRYSHSSVQGHHHGSFGVIWQADHDRVRWSMSTGCLIDINSPAFRYGSKQVVNRPIIGCGVICNGQPIPILMNLKTNGRWDGRIEGFKL